MGGDIRPLSIKVPRGVSPEEGGVAHGPLHPTINKSLETLMVLFVSFLLWFSVLFSGCSSGVFRLLGWDFAW